MVTANLQRRSTDNKEAGGMISVLAKRKTVKPITLTVKDKIKFARMAEIKVLVTSMNAEYEGLFDSLKSDGKLLPRVKTVHGELALDSRDNWKIINMSLVFISVGKAAFLKHCTISKAGIVDSIGEDGFDKLKNVGGVALDYTSKFYRLLKNKGH